MLLDFNYYLIAKAVYVYISLTYFSNYLNNYGFYSPYLSSCYKNYSINIEIWEGSFIKASSSKFFLVL